MGIRDWWRGRQERNRRLREDLALNSDRALIGAQVPELLGMSDVEGMAYTMRQIEEWNAYATAEMAAELAGRLLASKRTFEDEGRTMPYWGNLWVLRTLQAELGIAAPAVAPQVKKDSESGGSSA